MGHDVEDSGLEVLLTERIERGEGFVEITTLGFATRALARESSCWWLSRPRCGLGLAITRCRVATAAGADACGFVWVCVCVGGVRVVVYGYVSSCILEQKA